MSVSTSLSIFSSAVASSLTEVELLSSVMSPPAAAEFSRTGKLVQFWHSQPGPQWEDLPDLRCSDYQLSEATNLSLEKVSPTAP